MSTNCFYRNAADLVVENSPWESFGRLAEVNRNGDSTDIYGNIFLDPQFADTITWQLTEHSRCIDAGTDIGFPYEGLAPDIGYWEFVPDYILSRSESTLESSTKSDIRIFPNPANSSFTIQLDHWNESPTRVVVYNLLGQVVFSQLIVTPNNAPLTLPLPALLPANIWSPSLPLPHPAPCLLSC